MLTIFSNNNKSLVETSTLQKNVDETLSLRLERLGLVKTENYLWNEPTLKDIRKGFSYSILKGAAGTFTWGVNLDFLPIISGEKIVFHKSTKKYVHHLFEWTDEYASSFFGGQLVDGVTTHFGLKDTKKSILTLFERNEQKIIKWFDTAITVEHLIDKAEKQISVGKHYEIHHPKPKYVLAFLYAKAKNLDKASKVFENLSDDHFNFNKEVKEKVKIKLLMLAEEKNGT
jgi:hypothetical protein